MMAGRSRQLGGALAGELVPVLRAGCWESSWLQITTGSSSMVGRGAVTGAGVSSGGGTSPRRSVCRAWIAASSSGGVLGACWGTEELGWSERSRKKLRDVRQQSNGFENYEL